MCALWLTRAIEAFQTFVIRHKTIDAERQRSSTAYKASFYGAVAWTHELAERRGVTPSSGAHTLPGSPQRHPDTGSKTRRWLLRAMLALPTPIGPVRRRSGSRNRRRSPRVGRRPCTGTWESCSFDFARIFSRAGPRLATPGPATPQGLPRGRTTSLAGRFVSSTWRPGGIIFEA